MKRETLQKIFDVLLHGLARLEFCGADNIPSQGGVLITTNHMSRIDTLLLFLTPTRKDITALVADKYKKYPVFNWILDTGGIIWLDRDKADFGAFRVAAEWLKAGVALGIAPEGTRSMTGQLLEGKPGTVLLAMKANVPIVPVAIAGTESFLHDLTRLRRPKVTLTFGRAYTMPPMDRDHRDEWMQKMTDEIMCRIAVLLPPRYWGFYKDHPLLMEMLAHKEQYV